MNQPTARAEAAAQSAARSRWVEILARLGYAAKGVVYVIVGVISLQVAFGGGGQTAGSKGAIASIADEPFGQAMLWIIALGLFGYVVWRLVQGVMDVEGDGTDGEGLVKRAAKIVSAVIHFSLAVYAVGLATGDGSSSSSGGSGGGGTQGMTAQLMSEPWGRWLVGLIGVIVIGFALRQFYRAWDEKFRRKLAIHDLSRSARDLVLRAARFGIAARGVVFTMIGFFFVQAALTADPNRARGLDGALAELRDQAFGPWLLGLVAAGLVGYGIYCFLQARYRKIFGTTQAEV